MPDKGTPRRKFVKHFRIMLRFKNALRLNAMTSVALSPKFQIVIPKDVRKALNLVAGQRMEARVVGDHVELVPELPITSIRGMCPGINTDVPNDPEVNQGRGL